MNRFMWSALVVVAVACRQDPISWSEVSYGPTGFIGSPQNPQVAIPDALACQSSIRLVSGPHNQAMWWSVRSDSSAVLMYSSALPGGWAPTIKVDTTDRSSRGCNRPAPGIASDDEGRIYAAYFMEPPTGAGIFFAHRMDDTGFHDPIAIAYGKRPAEVSVATEGERVVVAYEEPNAERGQIWLALSNTMGHLFEYRGPISGASEVARHPIIQLHGTKLEVSWLELIQSDSSGRVRLARITGTWK